MHSQGVILECRDKVTLSTARYAPQTKQNKMPSEPFLIKEAEIKPINLFLPLQLDSHLFPVYINIYTYTIYIVTFITFIQSGCKLNSYAHLPFG